MTLSVPARTAAELLRVLGEAPVPDAPFAQRLGWIEAVVRTLRPPSRTGGGEAAEQAATARLRALLQFVRDDETLRVRCAPVVRSVLAELSAYDFLAETGTGRVGFAGEMLDRVSRRVLPSTANERDLGHLVERLFPTEADVTWLERVPSAVAAELWDVLEADGPPFGAFFDGAIGDAAAVVALRAAARGFADDIRARRADEPVRGSAFHALVPGVEALLEASVDDRPRVRGELMQVVGGCRRALGDVQKRMERSGVSVDLVYRLELIDRNLDRVGALTALLVRAEPSVAARTALDLMADLLRQRQETRSLRGLLRSSTHLLARKMVERAGHSGEHYITTSRGEHRHMFLTALGGGLVVGPTIAIKYLVADAHLPPFFEMAAWVTNYAGAFVLLHLLGGTLATKQPAVTAATLAAAIHAAGRRADVHGLAEQVARLTRSQLAAVAGNLLAVVPAALAIEALWRSMLGRSFLDPATAAYVLHSLHPLESGTVPFAILTGILLWSGSMIAAATENWWVYRQLPDALAQNPRLVSLLGAERAARLARSLTSNVAALSGNATLGAMLGMTPFAGRFFGIPLDVRHVTFSTGALALALAAAPAATPAILGALAGIVVIGALNLAVSFALALGVALRARDVRHGLRDVARSVWARLRLTPVEFVWPPADAPGAGNHAGSAALKHPSA